MKKNDHRNLTDLLALLVFGVFALCVAAVLLTGAGAYRNLVRTDQQTNDRRVAARYVTTRFRQAPSVTVEDFCGLDAMTVREQIGGRNYVTRVYFYDGYIRELFASETASLQPHDGTCIAEAKAMYFSVDEGLFIVEIVHPDGISQRLLLALPEWKEAQP